MMCFNVLQKQFGREKWTSFVWYENLQGDPYYNFHAAH